MGVANFKVKEKELTTETTKNTEISSYFLRELSVLCGKKTLFTLIFSHSVCD